MKKGDRLNIVLCGRGGQGILFATAVLEQAAMSLGLDVIGSETHGMAQRGGSVVSHLKVGESLSPLVASGEADILLSLESTETYRNLHFLSKGGTCFANFPAGVEPDGRVAAFLERNSIPLFRVDADSTARDLGSPQASNVALLGLLGSWTVSPFSADLLREAISKTGAERFRAKNLEVFEAGLSRALETAPSQGD
ncbi:MAG: indolepyruvate oxidoreductase subunit beta [Planctomycetota bacterium]|jgi:indolepyruvate ferredoxin oxidoreductase beta subunit